MSSFRRYFVVRSVQTVFLLWLVLTALFLLFRLMPGDFTTQMALAGASPEVLANVKARWGLDEPLYVQYWQLLKNYANLNLGQSPIYNTSIWDLVAPKIFNTFILVAPGITFAYILGSLIGTVTGSQRGSLLERYGIVPVIVAGAFPAFFTALILVVVFANWFNLFPPSGMLSATFESESNFYFSRYFTGNFIYHYTLPFVAIVLRYLFIPSLMMRTSVVEVMGADYTEFHRMTGISKASQLSHIAKHASLPLLTVYPASMTRAIGGLVLIETVFNWPGIGFLLVDSVLARDYPVIQFVFFAVATFVILSNFIVDLLYGVIDPRIHVEK
jgi:peptide/nickel transport system permease protein